MNVNQERMMWFRRSCDGVRRFRVPAVVVIDFPQGLLHKKIESSRSLATALRQNSNHVLLRTVEFEQAALENKPVAVG
jgi:hypothetical protein